MQLTFLSHTAMDGPFVVGSHQLAVALFRLGHVVRHVSAPLSLAHIPWAIRDGHVRTRWRRWLRGGERTGGVHELIPFTALPWSVMNGSSSRMYAYSQSMWTAPLRGLSGLQLQEADCLIVDEPRFVGLVCRGTQRPVIYRATDLYAQQRGDPSILTAEKAVCERADLLIATSNPVAEHLQTLSHRPVRLMTNGVDFDHFEGLAAAAADATSLPGQRETRAVYVGSFDKRFGGIAMRQAAVELPHITFILAGPGSRSLAASWALPNVLGLGSVRYGELPRLLHSCSVGLLPISAQAANAGRSPMKLYEYAAAGLSIAATATPEIRRRVLPTLCLSESDAEFSSAVRLAFGRATDRAAIATARECARAQSWSHKAAELADLIPR